MNLNVRITKLEDQAGLKERIIVINAADGADIDNILQDYAIIPERRDLAIHIRHLSGHDELEPARDGYVRVRIDQVEQYPVCQ